MAVEFGLCVPILVVLVMGGVHFGLALTTRHALADATSIATRSAAISGNYSSSDILDEIQAQMGDSADYCKMWSVARTNPTNSFDQEYLKVTATCTLDNFLTDLFERIWGTDDSGPANVTVTAAVLI